MRLPDASILHQQTFRRVDIPAPFNLKRLALLSMCGIQKTASIYRHRTRFVRLFRIVAAIASKKNRVSLAADGLDENSTFVPTRRVQAAEADDACVVKMTFTPENGEPYTLVDYASAGKDWESTMAAWLPRG